MTLQPPLPCPRCKELLTELGVRAGRATGCNRCRGVWLDDAAYAEVRAQSWALVIDEGAPKEPVMRDDKRALACPICREGMQKTELAHVAVDFCPGHGTWFDPGEIEAIAREIARHAKADAPSASRWLENARRMNASLQHAVDTLVTRDIQRRVERLERRERYDDD